ncbi:hypothetical protein EDB95_2503 [Dinghuibacter silviterrae]|uniref:Uncharacterized protein n=1 Tax=Dinghuibacter silviterrae TaxID=1539049 RepID=A0A4R8DVM7_9BACT|nr:hypothetical protein EDB95_2503 [Dinghuibacter silviterrae]
MKRYDIFQDRLTCLTPEERSTPVLVIDGFFQEFDLEFCRNLCGLALANLLCMADEDIGNEFTRTEILLFFESVERLIESTSFLQKQNKCK